MSESPIRRPPGRRPSQAWLSVAEAAELAGVSEQLIRTWVSRGRVGGRRDVHGRRWVSKADLARLLRGE